MKKLNSLNKEQELKILSIKEEWLDRIFKCKTELNRAEATKGIEFIYSLIGKAKPIIIFVDSPLACQYVVGYLKNIFNEGKIAKLLTEVRDQVGDQVRNQVWNQVWNQVRDQVGDQVWNQVWNQVRDQVWNQVGDQVGDQVGEFTSFSSYGNIWDYGWVSFYDYFQSIGIEFNNEKFNNFKSLITSGIYDMIQLDGFCIVSSLPISITRNNSNRLHNTKGSAIKFKDGYELHFINGRFIPSDVFNKAKTLTKKEFIKEKNSDYKGAWYEILGQRGIMELLRAIEIDTKQIVHKNGDIETVTLLKTKDKFEEIDNSPFAWIKMVCPSTGTQYLQGVSPHYTCALEAIASLSPFKKEEYTFDFRS